MDDRERSIVIFDGLYAHFLFGDDAKSFKRVNSADSRSFPEDFVGYRSFAREDPNIVRVYIDSSSGVNVDDCANISRQISSLLDVEGFLPERYVLEVSSPGLDRKFFEISQYSAYIGKKLRLV